jgi:hypothetical protein
MNRDLLSKMAADPKLFRSSLRIDCGGKVAVLGEVQDPWQRDDFQALDNSWLLAMGRAVPGQPPQRAWLERPRGSSQTSDLAVSVVFALAFAPRPIQSVAAAADQDQAGLLRNAIRRLLELNPWLGETLEVQQWRVCNRRTGSELNILASDVSSSFGLLVDVVIVDELSIWGDGRGEQFWGSLLSAIAKRPGGLLVAIMNAGFKESWQHKLRTKVEGDPNWHFSAVTQPASWIRPEHLDEQRHLLPGPVFDRLWRNEWSSGAGDALQESDIAASVIEQGPLFGPEEGWCYFGGLDLSISRHNSAAIVVGRDRQGFVKLACTRLWTPPKGGQVDLGAVRDSVLALNEQFAVALWGFDQFQAALLSQDLARCNVSMEPVSFAGRPSQEMASELIELFASRRIKLYDEPRLVADLRSLRISLRPGGFRLEAPVTSSGHADLGFALAMAAYTARQHRWRIEDLPPHPEAGQALCAGKSDPGAAWGPWAQWTPPAGFVPAGPRNRTGVIRKDW